VTRMRRFCRAFAAELVTAFALTTTYRAELLLWALSGTLPIILMGVWSEAARTGEMPYSPAEMARYFVAVLFVRQMTFVWVIWEFEEQVVSGTLSHALLRPIDPVWNYVANHLAERIVRLPIVFGLVGLCFALYPSAIFVPSPSAIALTILAVLASFTVRFALQYTFAMMCFATERASSVEGLSFAAFVFLSGMLAPLDLYPSWVATLAGWTPFPYLIYVPARILIGEPVAIWHSFGVLTGWAVLLIVTQRCLWWWGLNRYTGMGA